MKISLSAVHLKKRSGYVIIIFLIFCLILCKDTTLFFLILDKNNKYKICIFLNVHYDMIIEHYTELAMPSAT